MGRYERKSAHTEIECADGRTEGDAKMVRWANSRTPGCRRAEAEDDKTELPATANNRGEAEDGDNGSSRYSDSDRGTREDEKTEGGGVGIKMGREVEKVG